MESTRTFSKKHQGPRRFLGDAAQAITWNKKWTRSWMIRTSHSTAGSRRRDEHLLQRRSRHVTAAGRPDGRYLRQPVTNTVQKFTYKELLDQVRGSQES